MKKVLITGASGFIGKHLMSYILDNNLAEVYGIDALEGTNIFNHEAIPEIDTIFHLAGQTSVQGSLENPFFDALSNIMATIQLLKLYPEAKIIFSGSVASKDIKSPYGLSKKTAGEYIKMLAKDWTICNFPNVYGPRSKGVIDIWLNSKEISVNGWGVQTRTFVHVLDICKALIKATEWNKGEYDLGSGKETAIKDIALEIATRHGKSITYQNDKQGEILNSLVLNTTPDWSPEIDIYDYIKNNGQ